MRIIDEDKIVRIKKEAKNLIVEKGYHKASIAEIARKANVSDGYLYRHYKSKTDLVKDLFEEQLKQFHDHTFHLLETMESVRSVTKGIVSFLIHLSKEEPVAISFAHILVYDHEFEYPQSRHGAINKLTRDILSLGHKTGEVSKHIREIDILLTILTIPVKFIEYKNKGYGRGHLSEQEEKDCLVDLCMNALK